MACTIFLVINYIIYITHWESVAYGFIANLLMIPVIFGQYLLLFYGLYNLFRGRKIQNGRYQAFVVGGVLFMLTTCTLTTYALVVAE